MKIGLAVGTKTVATSQMVQYMTLLQMNNCDLSAYIHGLLEENPVLEAEPADAFPTVDQLIWLSSRPRGGSDYALADDDDGADGMSWLTEGGGDTLYSHIHEQLLLSPHSAELISAVEFLALCLDDRGYLPASTAELAASAGISEALLADGLSVLQHLSPSGLGARDLRECLLLQTDADPLAPEYARPIISGCLDKLGANKFDSIARSLEAGLDEVYEACNYIRSLDPKPGSRFSSAERTEYITPDIIVGSAESGSEISLNDSWIPRLSISQDYISLLRQGDAEVRDYLTQKYEQARVTLRSIEQRRGTLIKCVRLIAKRQEAFFRDPSSPLEPLLQRDLAEELGLSESAFSRAINGKYLQLPSGVYPLSRFFSRSSYSSADKGELSAQELLALLRKTISGEDHRSPLSDQQLSDRFKRDGIDIARRTVAKYRVELDLPSAAERRRIYSCEAAKH